MSSKSSRLSWKNSGEGSMCDTRAPGGHLESSESMEFLVSIRLHRVAASPHPDLKFKLKSEPVEKTMSQFVLSPAHFLIIAIFTNVCVFIVYKSCLFVDYRYNSWDATRLLVLWVLLQSFFHTATSTHLAWEYAAFKLIPPIIASAWIYICLAWIAGRPSRSWFFVGTISIAFAQIVLGCVGTICALKAARSIPAVDARFLLSIATDLSIRLLLVQRLYKSRTNMHQRNQTRRQDTSMDGALAADQDLPMTIQESPLHLAKADEHITWMVGELRAWRTYHNAAIPVGLLPVETLARIFSYLADMDVPVAPNYFGCMVVAHVCRQWRLVAINTPSLWTNVLQWKEDGTQIMLQRAGNTLPLRVHFHDLPAANFLSRLEILREPAPRLQALELAVHYGFWRTTHRVPVVPDHLLSPVHASLRHLSLENVFFNMKLRFTAIVSLELVYPQSIVRRAERRLLPTVSRLLSALGEMQTLQRLKLCNALAYRSNLTEGVGPFLPTPLPHLQNLETDMEIRLCTALLQRLEIPHDAQLDLRNVVSSNLERELLHMDAHWMHLQMRLTTFAMHSIAFHLKIQCRMWHIIVEVGSTFKLAYAISGSPLPSMRVLLPRIPPADSLDLDPFPTNWASPTCITEWNQFLHDTDFPLSLVHTLTVNCTDYNSYALFGLLQRRPHIMPSLRKLVLRMAPGFCRRIIWTGPELAPPITQLRGLLDQFIPGSQLQTIEVRTNCHTQWIARDHLEDIRVQVLYIQLPPLMPEEPMVWEG
ncbi:hypothetical protein EVG20_g4119 [Dentipellis fragilis]|uniref:F-box domain-containing protein n=1 Tax=Dentipellis fragilis TaxID=205917 RepID=A0A4Y9YZ77_9AGAM|nr:hypothetical protein EVG20_g4119 [Dentipellis fragilis]